MPLNLTRCAAFELEGSLRPCPCTPHQQCMETVIIMYRLKVSLLGINLLNIAHLRKKMMKQKSVRKIVVDRVLAQVNLHEKPH